LSQSFQEFTTEAVMDWLRAWKVPFIRINGDDIDRSDGPVISINNRGAKVNLVIDGVPIDPNAIKVVWYRRWAYNNKHNRIKLTTNESHQKKFNILSFFRHLHDELQTVSEFFFSMLSSAAWLGHPSNSSLNKLKVLKLAAELGLDIPDTLITTDIDNLRRFAKKHGAIIAKPASEILMCVFDEHMYATYASVIPEHLLNDAPWRGSFPSLFQERLKKKYEIRTFYLDGKCYSMAMFTQRHADTQTDFRRYTYENPTRTVPYQLPGHIENAIQALMKALQLDTGSIDIVRTVDGRFVFLEVNPVGQFGMVSAPCNYFLEREVARSLVNRLYGSTR
ncbi:MAG: grasp-with-spasm system ATP-grasp peptide maturase, partial [Pyrinomonadaceae bacterium]